tara:strand:- start:763 stop:1953 length:1191 start_codon:yes stop_codon:yes gene_type:complete
MTTASYPSDYKETEAREFNPETNSGIKLIQGSSKKKKAQSLNFKNESGIAAYMSYPIARTMQEKTGDTLRIKCVEYIPMDEGGPDDGFMGMKIKNSFITANYGNGREEILSNTKKNRDKVYKDTGQKIEKPEFNASFTDANTRMKNNVKSKYNIELPIPQELNDSNQVTWGDDRVNAIELAGLAIAQKFMEDGPADAIQKSQQAIRAMVSGMEFNDIGSQTTNAIRAAISGAAIGALGSNVSAKSVIARSTGQILNSNLELLFQGVNLRSFPYSITFSPRSIDEARVVKAIIRSLKQSMAPKAGEYNGSAQGIFLKSPDLFQLEYLKDGAPHPFLNKFKLAALTGMAVNYTNSGTYTSYEDGTPVNLRMDLTFKEINPIYFEDYLPGNGGDGGVGF